MVEGGGRGWMREKNRVGEQKISEQSKQEWNREEERKKV